MSTSAILVILIAVSMTWVTTTIASEKLLEMEVATEEMQKANYFTFVLLINMAPPDRFLGNITFLMPNDRTLSETNMAGVRVTDFLLNHSIPSPLLMDHLLHFPTGSMIPTSAPEFMLKVTNDGRRRFFLNNVRVTSPNICTRGFSIRCHGIDGVVQPITISPPAQAQPNIPAPVPPTCLNNTVPPVVVAPLPAPSPPMLAPRGLVNPNTMMAPSPPPVLAHANPLKSSSYVGFVTSSLLLSVLVFE